MSRVMMGGRGGGGDLVTSHRFRALAEWAKGPTVSQGEKWECGEGVGWWQGCQS